MMIVAYSSGPIRRDAVTWMRTPRPGSPRWKNWSPTIAPITDRPADVRRPTKIEGRGAGVVEDRRQHEVRIRHEVRRLDRLVVIRRHRVPNADEDAEGHDGLPPRRRFPDAPWLQGGARGGGATCRGFLERGHQLCPFL